MKCVSSLHLRDTFSVFFCAFFCNKKLIPLHWLIHGSAGRNSYWWPAFLQVCVRACVCAFAWRRVNEVFASLI